MDQFGGLLSPDTMSRQDPRSLAQVLEDALRRKHEDIGNQTDAYSLGQKQQLDALTNPIRDDALRSAAPGAALPSWATPQSQQAPQGLAQPANLPQQLQAGDAAIRSQPSWAPAQNAPSRPEDVIQQEMKNMEGIRQQQADFNSFKNSKQGTAQMMSNPWSKAQIEGQGAQLENQMAQSSARIDLAKNQIVNALIPKMNAAMVPDDPKNGFNPLTGEKGMKLQAASALIPPSLLDNPKIQDWLKFQKAEQQQTVFNPMMGAGMILRPQMQAESRISSENQKQSADYEKVKGPALAFKADYDNYKQAIASGDKQAIKIAQQGMVDKYITTSTQKSTGDAQFNNFISGQGIQNTLQNLGDKLVDGSMAPEKVFDTMRDITMSTADKFRQKVQQTNAMTRNQADKENRAHPGFAIDPESLITHPDDMLAQDSAAFKSGGKNAGASYSPAVMSQAKAYLALPANQQDPAIAAHAKKVVGQ